MSALVPPVATTITYFQAIVLGLLQGVTELFPISSLGHTVLFPTLFGWNRLVKSQSQPESFWLAFVVMLHVGSALGLLLYFWRDWVADRPRFFRTLARAACDDADERLAWLIIAASIPAGDHRPGARAPAAHAHREARTGVDLPDRQRHRSCSPPSASAAAPRCANWRPARACKPDGGRELDTLEYREALVIGVAQSTRAGRRDQPRRRDDGRGPRARTRPQRIRLASRSCSRRRSSSPPACSSSPTCSVISATAIRGQALVAAAAAAVTAVFTVGFLLRFFKTRTLMPFAVYCLLFGISMIVYTQT